MQIEADENLTFLKYQRNVGGWGAKADDKSTCERLKKHIFFSTFKPPQLMPGENVVSLSQKKKKAH